MEFIINTKEKRKEKQDMKKILESKFKEKQKIKKLEEIQTQKGVTLLVLIVTIIIF